ncbi:MAG: PilZ domain-containing protein [Deltaproteobacteria bacterium]|nr:PilZ domain-containing protein [Deltaproteobacteria bacterium]
MEKRRFARTPVAAQQHLLFFNPQKKIHKDIVVSKNLSAGGACFRSATPIEAGTYALAYLDENALDDLKTNRGNILKTGNYFMGRIVWNRPSEKGDDPFYEVGFAFLGRNEGDLDSMDLFTHLINHFTAEQIKSGALPLAPPRPPFARTE